jgi:hypothetical protein
MLGSAGLFQTPSPRLTDHHVEDLYYRAHDRQRNWRLPLASMVTLVAVLALALDVLPH